MTDETDKRLADSRQPKSPETNAVSLDEPIQKLISEGAAAIGLEKELYRWSDGNLLSFRVYMSPVTGGTIVDEYDAVVVNGETYNLEWTFTLDGPHFFKRVPVYADNNILGMEPVSVNTGWENLREFLREDGNHGGD